MSEQYGVDPRSGAAALLRQDRRYYAICIAPIYLCVLLLCRLVLSHFLCTSVAAIHGGTVEDTFSFEKPVHKQTQGYLDNMIVI